MRCQCVTLPCALETYTGWRAQHRSVLHCSGNVAGEMVGAAV
jgi:hypothetical protein